MTYDYAFFICSNGLGHLRRSVAIAQRLPGRSVILTSATNFARLRPKVRVDFEKIEVQEWDSGITGETMRRGFHMHPLVPMVSTRVVVSDNLPDILGRYPEAILQGSFLWHEAWALDNPSYRAFARDLLAKHNPRMIGVDAFAMPQVREQTRFTGVGLYKCCEPQIREKDALLIACGRGGKLTDEFRTLIGELVEPPDGIQTVYVEPELIPRDRPTWMHPASFDCAMYARLKAAIIRPGLGTISDVLSAGAPVFAVTEPGNAEMAHNAQRIQDLNCGQQADSALDAYARAVGWLKAGYRMSHDLTFSGIEETVAILEGL